MKTSLHPPYGASEEEGEHFAKGGMAKHIAKSIMRKKYAEGDEVAAPDNQQANQKEMYGSNLKDYAQQGKGQGHKFSFPGMADGGKVKLSDLSDEDLDRLTPKTSDSDAEIDRKIKESHNIDKSS